MSSGPPPDWYDAEESTRTGMIAELQRLRRRTRVRPLPVLLLAALIMGGIGYKLAKKQQRLEAEVILALTEGSMTSHHSGIPADQLREYVTSVLIPDSKLLELIKRRNLYPLRATMGDQYAIDELRSDTEIATWKNSFVYYDEDDEKAQKSARIGITVYNSDPDRAFGIARDLAAIAIAAHEIERKKVGDAVAAQVKTMRTSLEARLRDTETAIVMKQVAIDLATKRHEPGMAAAMGLDIANLVKEHAHLEGELDKVASSPDAIANEISAAGLDMTLSIVEERRPDRPEHSSFVLVMILVVIGTGALIGAAMIVGAFDSRIHDTDDVERLGLPVLGHVPGFSGDHVGSLRERNLVMRWRSHL